MVNICFSLQANRLTAVPMMQVQRHVGTGLPNPAETPGNSSEIEQILDLARWTPSGDNIQPWRFEILGDDRVLITVTQDNDIYDHNDGQATLLSAGMLLETMRLGASRFGRRLEWRYLGREGLIRRIEANLPKDSSVVEDSLCEYVTIRSVNRRSYRAAKLNREQKQKLTDTLGGELRVQWYESVAERWRTARLNARASDIRLRLRSAYEVHRRIIDWENKFSPNAIPADAIGLDGLTLGLMRWMMADWNRIAFMNRLPGATSVPQLEMDLLPGMFCASHFVVERLKTPAPGDETASLLRAGQAMQRFWLTATGLGLSMQPAFAAINFAIHGASGDRLRDTPLIERKARSLARKLTTAEGFDAGRTLFRGRIGRPARAAVQARSIRKPLSELIE
jgi:sulfur-carrier protein adenylyltransferase/sulfurtransferase